MYIVSRIIIFYIGINIIYKLYKNKDIDIKKFNEEDFSDSDESDCSENTQKIKKVNKTYVISKKNENIQETVHKNSSCEEDENEEAINNYQLIVYKENTFLKTTNKIKHNLLEIYDNFFKGKKKKLVHDIDLDLLKKDISVDNSNDKDLIILSKAENNMIIDKNNNFIEYKFNVKKNLIYKIKCKILLKDVKNIKLIILENHKRFLYDFIENNLIHKNINEYGFILDNNNFNIDSEITIKFIFDFNVKYININNILIEIIEKKNNNSDLPIIIFDVNKNFYPLYFEINNILDYVENIKDDIFFI
jgi:hypothetical protein